MELTKLKGEVRGKLGTAATRKLREAGKLPAIVYGHGETPQSIAFDTHEVIVALNHGVRTIEVDAGGTTQQCLIKEVQYDYLDQNPLHLDLTRVNLDERVRVKVAIELKGTPKGIADGGILEQHINELEVECLVTQIPDTLHPLVSELELGEGLSVKDIELPDGVVVMHEPDDRVATVRAQTEEVEAEPTEDGEQASSEPEMIGRVRKDESEKTDS